MIHPALHCKYLLMLHLCRIFTTSIISSCLFRHFSKNCFFQKSAPPRHKLFRWYHSLFCDGKQARGKQARGKQARVCQDSAEAHKCACARARWLVRFQRGCAPYLSYCSCVEHLISHTSDAAYLILNMLCTFQHITISSGRINSQAHCLSHGPRERTGKRAREGEERSVDWELGREAWIWSGSGNQEKNWH